MLIGRIIKGIAGFYYVDIPEIGIYECRARGIFRKDGKKPLVGDLAGIEVTHEGDKEGNLIEIIPRKNELFRPAAANVDQALVLFALRSPDPNLMVLDRFLIAMQQQNVPAAICFNKTDLARDGEVEALARAYEKCGAKLFFISLENSEELASPDESTETKASPKEPEAGRRPGRTASTESDATNASEEETGNTCPSRKERVQGSSEDSTSCLRAADGLLALRGFLEGKTTLLAGPSGVGKSTLTNACQSGIRMETGEISRKLLRGKNTTRHAQLIPAGGGTYLMDTPGFTFLETRDLPKENLRFFYPEFTPYEGRCRFDGCTHIHEPDCRVREALAAGDISKTRYENYTHIYADLAEQEKHRY